MWYNKEETCAIIVYKCRKTILYFVFYIICFKETKFTFNVRMDVIFLKNTNKTQQIEFNSRTV